MVLLGGDFSGTVFQNVCYTDKWLVYCSHSRIQFYLFFSRVQYVYLVLSDEFKPNRPGREHSSLCLYLSVCLYDCLSVCLSH